MSGTRLLGAGFAFSVILLASTIVFLLDFLFYVYNMYVGHIGIIQGANHQIYFGYVSFWTILA